MTTRWWIGVHRTLMQTTEVTVEAETKDEAEKLALANASADRWISPGPGAPVWGEPTVVVSAVKYAEVAPPAPKPRSPAK